MNVRCMAVVYSRALGMRPCGITRDIRLKRWAGDGKNPLRTSIYMLCSIHRTTLERNGRLNLEAR